ncbi:MAG TPA: hypothetical protein VMD04_03110 [Candidatus Margulisiibacteriota bacterium]|nr:hypothetical protein [Candidatus Margulisiibacteriota bacterium]
MGIRLRIAGFDIFIRGNSFFRLLSPKEKKLLNNFLIAKKNPTRQSRHPITVNIKTIKKDKIHAPQAINREQALLLWRNFPEYAPAYEYRFEKIFYFFVESILPHYLKEYRVGNKEFLTLLKRGLYSNRIIASLDEALICRDKLRVYDIIYRHPSFHNPSLLKLWPYNLSILLPLMRMLLNSSGKGLFLHASSVEYAGFAYLFVGPGNSGKSTTAKLCAAERMLSDDISLIKKIGNSYYSYPNPWWNLSSKNPQILSPQKPVRLKSIFFIKKSGKTKLEKISSKESLKRLIYSDSPFQQMAFIDNKSGLKSFYLATQDLATGVPSFILYIKKSPKFKEEFRVIVEEKIGDG